MKTVIDISKWQIVSNYTSIANSVDGVLIRCGYRGSSTGQIAVDQKFATHVNYLVNNKCPIGLYFFTNAITEAEAREEATYVIATIKNMGLSLSFPIIIDTEFGQTSKDGSHNGRADKLDKVTRTKNVIAFIEQCRAFGYEAAIYASDSWFVEHLEYDKIKKYKKWVAKYGGSEIKYTKDNVIGWQKTSIGMCSGISGNVDMSDWYIDIDPKVAIYSKVEIPVVKETIDNTIADVKENKSNKLETGQIIELNDAPLYASSTTSKIAATKSGKFYVWNSIKRSGRIRITTKPEYVEDTEFVTGWINVSDIL